MSSVKRWARRGVERLFRAVGATPLRQEVEDLRREVLLLREWVAVADAELWNPPYTAPGADLQLAEGPDAGRLGFTSSRRSGSAYLGFEDVFRGTESFVQERQRYYLPLLPSNGTIVDIGCGRGEMLELLTAAGREAVGVDTDEGMVARCAERGLRAVHRDALDYLDGVEEASVAAVFSAQFVEHVDTETLSALLLASLRVLRPGGVMIAETVNPHSVSALRTFWVDLTHQRPIFPESLLVLCRELGYEEGRVVFPYGTGEPENDRRHAGEYAVVARRR